MKRGYIYKLFFLEEPKTIYIGKAIDVEKRFKGHLSPSQLKPSTLKTNWIKSRLKLGWTPSYYVIESSVVPDTVNALEVAWIQFYRNQPDFIVKNSTSGGEGLLGVSMSDETKQKISKSSLGKVILPTTREKIRKANTGIVRSDEFKRRCSEAQSNRSLETREKLSSANAKYTYELLSPDAELFIVTNLTKFCKENDINRSNLSSVVSGKRDNSNGWKARRMY